MKSRNIVGKKVKRVHQGIIYPPDSNLTCCAVFFIEFEDGSRIYPHVVEGQAEYFVEMTYRKAKP